MKVQLKVYMNLLRKDRDMKKIKLSSIYLIIAILLGIYTLGLIFFPTILPYSDNILIISITCAMLAFILYTLTVDD